MRQSTLSFQKGWGKLQILPPRTPYVNIRTGTLLLKEANKNPAQAKMLPANVTGLHPNLLVKPLTTGPEQKVEFLHVSK